MFGRTQVKRKGFRGEAASNSYLASWVLFLVLSELPKLIYNLITLREVVSPYLRFPPL